MLDCEIRPKSERNGTDGKKVGEPTSAMSGATVYDDYNAVRTVDNNVGIAS